jgi:hypothetical protein
VLWQRPSLHIYSEKWREEKWREKMVGRKMAGTNGGKNGEFLPTGTTEAYFL